MFTKFRQTLVSAIVIIGIAAPQAQAEKPERELRDNLRYIDHVWNNSGKVERLRGLLSKMAEGTNRKKTQREAKGLVQKTLVAIELINPIVDSMQNAPNKTVADYAQSLSLKKTQLHKGLEGLHKQLKSSLRASGNRIQNETILVLNLEPWLEKSKVVLALEKIASKKMVSRIQLPSKLKRIENKNFQEIGKMKAPSLRQIPSEESLETYLVTQEELIGDFEGQIESLTSLFKRGSQSSNAEERRFAVSMHELSMDLLVKLRVLKSVFIVEVANQKERREDYEEWDRTSGEIAQVYRRKFKEFSKTLASLIELVLADYAKMVRGIDSYRAQSLDRKQIKAALIGSLNPCLKLSKKLNEFLKEASSSRDKRIRKAALASSQLNKEMAKTLKAAKLALKRGRNDPTSGWSVSINETLRLYSLLRLEIERILSLSRFRIIAEDVDSQLDDFTKTVQAFKAEIEALLSNPDRSIRAIRELVEKLNKALARVEKRSGDYAVDQAIVLGEEIGAQAKGLLGSSKSGAIRRKWPPIVNNFVSRTGKIKFMNRAQRKIEESRLKSCKTTARKLLVKAKKITRLSRSERELKERIKEVQRLESKFHRKYKILDRKMQKARDTLSGFSGPRAWLGTKRALKTVGKKRYAKWKKKLDASDEKCKGYFASWRELAGKAIGSKAVQ